MSRIFVCYRREDSAGHAGRLFDGLKGHFGKQSVFMDVAGSIEPGIDFVEAIDRAVGSCDALLVVIGRKWLTCADEKGRRRLDDPEDFIRLETGTALRRDIRVVPVLVQGAKMPEAADLPEDLVPLARRQAIELSDTRWDFDEEKLVGALRNALSPGPDPKPPRKLLKVAVAAALVVGAVWAGWALWPRGGASKAGRAVETPAAAEAEVKLVEVPSVLGRTFDEARRELDGNGLKPGTVERVPSGRPEGTVMKQAPAAGKRIQSGSSIDLWLATGQAQAQPRVSERDYETIQALYERTRVSDSCTTAVGVVSRLEAHAANTNLVPEEHRRTVRYGSPSDPPTIAELARDRIIRIQRASADCFR